MTKEKLIIDLENEVGGDTGSLDSQVYEFNPPGADVSWEEFGKEATIATSFRLKHLEKNSQESLLLVPSPYSGEMILNPARFKPLFGIEGEDETSVRKKFRGRILRSPDVPKLGQWSDFRPQGNVPWEEDENLMIPREWKDWGPSTVYNLYFKASDLFQEFVWDVAMAVSGANIFAFNDVGVYIREKKNRFEAWSPFVDRETDSRHCRFGGTYDLKEAFPKNIGKWKIKKDKLFITSSRKGDKMVTTPSKKGDELDITPSKKGDESGITPSKKGDELSITPSRKGDELSITPSRKGDELGITPLGRGDRELPIVFWSAERMAPFDIAYKPDRSRIATQKFFARNGVGFKGKEREVTRRDEEYWEVMATYEARAIMRTLEPMHPVSIPEMEIRLRRGEDRSKVHLEGGRVEKEVEEDQQGGGDDFLNRIRAVLGHKVDPNEGRKRKRGLVEEKEKTEHNAGKGEKGKVGEEFGVMRGHKKMRNIFRLEEEEKEKELIPKRGEEGEKEVEGEVMEIVEKGEGEEDTQSMVSEWDELGVGGIGVPMSADMKKNLAISEVIAEKGHELRLGINHALSPLQYVPRKCSYPVKSTGSFLRKTLAGDKTFDPFAFEMPKEVRDGEEARHKTLCVDFVIGRTPPLSAGEDPLLYQVAQMLTKCYNKFLFIGRCMEVGDERAVWATIKDAVFSTAHNMTRVNDARAQLVTGSASYTSRMNTGGSLIREKVKERIRKDGVKREGFFREGGGWNDPPQYPYTALGTDFVTTGIYSGGVEQDDILAGSILADPGPRFLGNESRAHHGGGPIRFTGRDRGEFMGRGGDRGFNAAAAGRRVARQRYMGGDVRGRSRGSTSGRGQAGGAAGTSWGDAAESPSANKKWGN
jgi:hypothetical protein